MRVQDLQQLIILEADKREIEVKVMCWLDNKLACRLRLCNGMEALLEFHESVIATWKDEYLQAAFAFYIDRWKKGIKLPHYTVEVNDPI